MLLLRHVGCCSWRCVRGCGWGAGACCRVSVSVVQSWAGCGACDSRDGLLGCLIMAGQRAFRCIVSSCCIRCGCCCRCSAVIRLWLCINQQSARRTPRQSGSECSKMAVPNARSEHQLGAPQGAWVLQHCIAHLISAAVEVSPRPTIATRVCPLSHHLCIASKVSATLGELLSTVQASQTNMRAPCGVCMVGRARWKVQTRSDVIG